MNIALHRFLYNHGNIATGGLCPIFWKISDPAGIRIQYLWISCHWRIGAGHNVTWVSEYCFTLLSAESWQYCDRRKPESGTMPYSYFEWLQGFFIVYSSIGSNIHSRLLNSLEHCKCTTTMPNIQADRYSSMVPPYKPQAIRMSHRGQPNVTWAELCSAKPEYSNCLLALQGRALHHKIKLTANNRCLVRPNLRQSVCAFNTYNKYD